MAALTGFWRGDTYTFSIDLSETGVDISGHDFYFTLKENKSDTDAQAKLQHVHTAPADAESAAGRTVVTVPSSLTDLVDPGLYHFDIQWMRGAGDPVTLLGDGENPDGTDYEKFQVFEDVTRTQP